MQDKTGNPAFGTKALERIDTAETSSYATVKGTMFKILILLAIVFASGYFGWQAVSHNSAGVMIMMFGSLIAALIFAMLAIFIPKTSPITAPLYALAEGYLLGVISKFAENSYGGIVVQAIALTGIILFTTLFLYQARVIKVTEKFRSVVIIATVGIFVYYLVAMILGLFGINMPLIYNTGTFGIIFSLIVVFIASLNLFLDYDFVEKTAASKSAPKVFEWYGAFGLMVTLVWLYISVIRLLGNSR